MQLVHYCTPNRRAEYFDQILPPCTITEQSFAFRRKHPNHGKHKQETFLQNRGKAGPKSVRYF